jgi:hypothetical protein
MTEKPHMSQSQLGLASKCPVAWEFRYVKGIKAPPGIAALQGTGTHGGIQLNFEQKKTTHEDLPAADIVDASVERFKAECHGGYVLDEDAGRPDRVIAEATDEVAALAGLYAREIAPEYQPVLVEERVRIELPNSPVDIIGVLDMADDKRRVRDFKTSGKRKTQAEVDSSLQLTIYSIAHKIATGEPAADVGLEVLVKKSTPERQTLVSDRGPEDYEVLANRANAFIKMQQSGVFVPAPLDAWWCSKKWCGYFGICPYVKGSGPVVSLPPTDEPKPKKPRVSRPKKTIDPDAAPIVIQSSSSGGRPGPFKRKIRPKMKISLKE